VTANRLLKDPKIAAYIAERQSKRLEKVGLSAEMALEAIRRPLVADIRKLFDENGRLRPIVSLDDESAALIAGFEVIVKNAEAGDGHMDTVHKVKVVDRARYVEMAAKHFGLLIEKVNHSGEVSFKWQA
jgi:phage terminase small subunit